MFLLFLTVAEPLDHATGLEKKEMLAQLAGNEVSCDVSRSANTPIRTYSYGFDVLMIYLLLMI